MNKPEASKLARKLVTKARTKAELQKGEGHLKAAKQESETSVKAFDSGIPCAGGQAKKDIKGLVKQSGYESGEAKGHAEVAKRIMGGDRKALRG